MQRYKALLDFGRTGTVVACLVRSVFMYGRVKSAVAEVSDAVRSPRHACPIFPLQFLSITRNAELDVNLTVLLRPHTRA